MLQNKTGFTTIYLYRRVVMAKLFIDSHYANNIDLHNIANEAFFSKFHFTRLFKKIYGLSPHKYLTQVRLNNAKELLKAGTAVTDVCYLVGFESISSFTGLFKKYSGITPSAFRLSELKRQADMATAPLTFIPHCFAEKKGWVKKSNFEEAPL